MRNDHKPLAKFLNGKNANNKVKRWELGLATCNITFEWISGAKDEAADCLSRLVEQTCSGYSYINMLTVTHTDGPAFNTRSQTKQDSTNTTSSAPPVLHLTFPQTPAQTPNHL